MDLDKDKPTAESEFGNEESGGANASFEAQQEDSEYIASSQHYATIAGGDASSVNMTEKKEKTLGNSLKMWFRDLKESMSHKDDAQPSAIATASTENEKSYEGLNKKYIFIALSVILAIIMGSLFKDFLAPPKKKAAKKTELQTVAGRKLEDVPKDYSALAAEEKRRKAEQAAAERAKKKANAQPGTAGAVKTVNGVEQRVVETPKPQKPAAPRVAPRPPVTTQQVIRKTETQKLTEDAIRSEIGFGSLNTKLKAEGKIKGY